ncbi:MAG: KH domain-containing protein [Acidobacteria bacterium]|nr:KH domain-containing protein [Acidobacteriota bacterium]
MASPRQVVEVIARALADRPDEVQVTESEHRGTTVLELFMAPGDLGRVIGRNGRTAAAVRTLVNAAAERDGKRVMLEFRDAPDARHHERR